MGGERREEEEEKGRGKDEMRKERGEIGIVKGGSRRR